MLYYPWRDEDHELRAEFQTFKEHFDNVERTVRRNETKFSKNAQELDRAYDDLQQNGPPEDAWDAVAPNAEFQQAEQQDEGMVNERDLPEERANENIDFAGGTSTGQQSELHCRFSAELGKTLMEPRQYRVMMRSLNPKQKDVLKFHRKWCKDAIVALKTNRPVAPYRLFLSGPGGVGKSHIIKLVHYDTMKLLKPLSGHFEPDELPLLLTSFTGTAAFGIEGTTLHSALSFSCGPNKKKDYQPASSEKLNTLRSRLGKLKLLIIDEVSMVGADLLYHVHKRLQDITGRSDPDSRFGDISILAVGDLYQLQPVGQNHVFGLPSDSYARLHGSLWEENFTMMELTESMRQKHDDVFAKLLSRVRTATCTAEDIALLKTRVVSKSDSSYPAEELHVFKTNKEVDEHNSEHLKTIQTRVFDIRAIDQKKDVQTGMVDVAISAKPSDTGGLREMASVAVGARAMVTVNIDVSDGLANGVCGTIVNIDHTNNTAVHAILVEFDSDRVGKEAIINSQYRRDFPRAVPIKRHDVQVFTGRGRRSVEAKRRQFPLTLAWGCTIHKAQGKTMDKIVVTMEGRGNFMPGQAYVALSRVRTLQGLFLLGFNESAIRINNAVTVEMERLRKRPLQLTTAPPVTVGTDVKINFLNVRSYREHLVDLKADETITSCDVFCFVETFLQNGQPLDPEHQVLPDALCFRADRPATMGKCGGVMVVSQRACNPRRLQLPVPTLEHVAVTLRKDTVPINMVAIYRPQTVLMPLIQSCLEKLVKSLPANQPAVILGDFNIDIYQNSQHTIINLMEDLGFRQHVREPTTDSGSLLDHVYTNRMSAVCVKVTDIYFSDHDLISVSLSL